MSTIRYRPDIDGLRAIAILFVVLYHADINPFDGGFIGVDVFFVISGFLITSLIQKALGDGTFTLGDFWERRMRRILPALFLVVASTLAAGWFILLPDDFAALGREAAAQSIFASNILFYGQAGYFDQAAALKPLLHTWSLSIEEQFYVIYPLLLFLVWTYAREHLAPVLFLSAVLSFSLCLYVMQTDKNLAFYTLPFRCWELLAGALVAVYGGRIKKPDGIAAEVFAALGLLCVVLPAYLYNDKTSFPGVAALPPVFGAALLIWMHGEKVTCVSRLFSTGPAVFTGRISYGWYLWHWPVMVLATYNPAHDFTQKTALIICVAVSFILAVLTWRFVEQPFRQRKILPGRGSLYAFAALCLLSLGGAGLFLAHTKGFPARLDPVAAGYASATRDRNPLQKACDKTSVQDIEAGRVCQTLQGSGKQPAFILWGDSQADSMVPAFISLSERYGRNGYILTHHACEAVLDFRKSTWETGSACNEFNSAVFSLIKRSGIKHVFLISRYNAWLSQNFLHPEDVTLEGPYPEGYGTMLAAGMARTFDRLRAQGVRVYVLIEVPSVPFDPPRTLAMEHMKNPHHLPPRLGLSTKSYTDSINAQLGRMLDTYGRDTLTLIDPSSYLCPGMHCIVADEGRALYYDSSHVSGEGAKFLMPLFEPYFKEGFKP